METNNHTDLDLIERYPEGSLDEQERDNVRIRLDKDPEFSKLMKNR